MDYITAKRKLQTHRCANCEEVLAMEAIVEEAVITAYHVFCPVCQTDDSVSLGQLRRQETEAAEVYAALPSPLRARLEEPTDPELVAAVRAALW